MPITALPTPPSRSDPANFAVRADAFLLQLNQFGTEANALQADVNAKQAATAASDVAAAISEANAASSASSASSNASAAATSETNAANSAATAAAKALEIDKIYLGSKASNPSVDNQGDPLITGMYYYNSVAQENRYYTGSGWSTQNLVDTNYVTNSGDQSINGIKTFNSSPVVPAGATGSKAPRASDVPGLVFPTGTVMLFVMSAAPTGWTKSTEHNDKALRVVSGSAGSGGSVSFTTAFTNRSITGSVGSTTLTTGQIPAHSHVVASRFADGGTNSDGNAYANIAVTGVNAVPKHTQVDGGTGGSHNHSFTGNSVDLRVSYVDCIIAIKD